MLREIEIQSQKINNSIEVEQKHKKKISCRRLQSPFAMPYAHFPLK